MRDFRIAYRLCEVQRLTGLSRRRIRELVKAGKLRTIGHGPGRKNNA